MRTPALVIFIAALVPGVLIVAQPARANITSATISTPQSTKLACPLSIPVTATVAGTPGQVFAATAQTDFGGKITTIGPTSATLPSTGTSSGSLTIPVPASGTITYTVSVNGQSLPPSSINVQCLEVVPHVVAGPQLGALTLAPKSDPKNAKCPGAIDVTGTETGPPGATLSYYYVVVVNGKTSTLHGTSDAGTPQQPYRLVMPSSGSVQQTESIPLLVLTTNAYRVELHAWMNASTDQTAIPPLESVAVSNITCAPPQVTAVSASTPDNYRAIPCPADLPVTLTITGVPGWPVTYGYQTNFTPAESTQTQGEKQFTATMPDTGTLTPSFNVRVPSLQLASNNNGIYFFAHQSGAGKTTSIVPKCLFPTISNDQVLPDRRSLHLLVTEALAAKPGGVPACSFTILVSSLPGTTNPQFNGYGSGGTNDSSGKVIGSGANLAWSQIVDMHWSPPASGRYALDVKADGSGCAGELASTFVW